MSLADHRVVSIATLGLVAGKLKGLPQPALVLTPLDEGTAVDDGLLTASDIVQLKHGADGVVPTRWCCRLSIRWRKVRAMAVKPQPAHGVEPDVETPNADLLAREAELTERLLSHDRLEDVLGDIADIHELIADARPRTLAGAAVLLSRALVAIEAHDCRSPWRQPERVEGRLVEPALGVIEGLDGAVRRVV